MIYIATHTDFDEYIKNNDNYKIIAKEELKKDYTVPVIVADNDIAPMQFAYSEGFLIRDIQLKTNDEWVGLNHYRRYFDNPQNETTIPTAMNVNMHQQYASCHNINDLLQCEDIINEYFPEYSLQFDRINQLYICNMFIMKREDFEEYCNFVFGVLEKFNDKNNLHTDEDVYNYVSNNAKNGLYGRKQIDTKYQARLHGFLMERLGTIFFIIHFINKGEKVTFKPIHMVGNRIRNY